MEQKTLIINNKLGLHARASAKLVATANRFASKIDILKNDRTVSGKSIMGVMMLAANKGTEITIITEGEDEKKAMEAIADLINDKFGEAE